MSQAGIINTGDSGAIITIAGDVGTISGPAVTIYANRAAQNSGSTVGFDNSGTISTLNVSDALNNTIIGYLAGNGTITGTSNVGLGSGVFVDLTSGTDNHAVGLGVLKRVTSGQQNVGVGSVALQTVSTGSFNHGVGIGSLGLLETGSYNLALGWESGIAYINSESSNILLTNTGVLGESNTIRIGTQGSGDGEQDTCYIAGIVGISVSNPQYVTIDSSTGQLGVSTEGVSAWIDEAVSFNAVAGNGYFVTANATATLPAAPNQGDTIEFFVDGAVTLTIQANTGQTIQMSSSVSSSAGTKVNTASGDAATIVYRSTDTKWCATSFVGSWSST